MNTRTTLIGSPVVAAPGKVFLIGEYAVLEEGSAVLAAISRQAVAQYMPHFEHATPLIGEVVRHAVAALGELATALPAGSVLVDTQQFQVNGHKLGLGSSAAAAVTTAGAVFEYLGRPLAEHRDLVYAVADAGHRAAQQGVGSGADLAAAVHGGFIHFFRPSGGVPAVTKLQPPPGLTLTVFWTGASAATPNMIAAVRAFAQQTPPLYKWLMDEMRSLSSRFLQEFTSGGVRGVIDITAAYGDAMKELGAAAGVPIVTPAFTAAAKLARSLGGAAKPSGAGGGDIGVAWFPDPDAAQAFSEQCPAGISVLDVRVDPRGLHRRVAGQT